VSSASGTEGGSEDASESGDKGSPAAAIIGDSLKAGIGGKRGLFDSTFPTAAFVFVYIISGSSLLISLWAAVGTGLIVVLIRLVRKETLRQVLTGFLGVAISAGLAAWTGEAQDFFLPGLLLNGVYGAAFAVSVLVGRPLAGYAAGAVTGDVTGWREHPEVRKAANMATWIWAAVFALRLLVQVPLFLAGAVGALGVAKIVMGVPLFLLAGLMSYRIMRPAMSKMSPMISPETDGEQSVESESPQTTRETPGDQQAPGKSE
jgi:hypothetical protein